MQRADIERVQREGLLQEEILHDVRVVLAAAVGEVAGSEHDDGIQALAVIT